MKLIETLTNQQKIDLLNGVAVGIFPTMILSNDKYYSKLYELCLGYYTERSGEKTISATYDKYISLSKLAGVTETPESLLGKLIRGKFVDKWDRIYDTLIDEQYNPLNNSESVETKTGNNKNTDTYNTVTGKQGNNTDTTTFDTNVEDDGNTATNEKTVRTVNSSDGVYGFNSNAPVGDTNSNETVDETVTGDRDKNTTHNVQTKTGTETKQFGISESETHTGTDSSDITINETFKKEGRNVSGAELIEKELNLRNSQIFFDIIYKDIDSVTTLSVYS